MCRYVTRRQPQSDHYCGRLNCWTVTGGRRRIQLLVGCCDAWRGHSIRHVETWPANAANIRSLCVDIGVVAAFIAARISVKWMVSDMFRHGLERFSYYRVVIAVFATVFLLATKLV